MSDAVERAGSVAERIASRAAKYDTEASFPADDIADLREAGLLGLMVPPRLGGMGAGFEEYAEVAMALAAGSGATALLFNMHVSVTGALASISDGEIHAFGARDSFVSRRDEILARAAQGALYGVAISERGIGSRLSQLQTTYERDGDGYRIRGQKSTCSGAGFLDGYLIAARARDGGEQPVVSYLFLPASDGIRPVGSWDPIGMRATVSRGVELDVHVDEDAMLGGIEGLVLPLAASMPQWLVASYAAVYVGLAASALQVGAAYIAQRGPGNRTGGPSQAAATRARLGRADADVAAARLAVREAARRIDLDAGSDETNTWIYRSKLLAGDVASSVTSSLAEACGLSVLSRGSPFERIYRDARCGAIMPPSSDTAAAYLGSATAGENPNNEVQPW
ncbi:MAG TPA: acyl-CoA dehydrogenase family protein [Actinomycetota bacterium]|nr:acyl-CoA dehydrogenase family protein [Actinomycetota bacterium]